MAKARSRGFRCGTCGRVHPGLPTEWGFREPDEVFALSYIAKYLRTRINADLCTLDDSRYFLRGLLGLPFTEASGELTVTKTPSTPADPAVGFMTGLTKVLGLTGADPRAIASVSHGTTIATKTMVMWISLSMRTPCVEMSRGMLQSAPMDQPLRVRCCAHTSPPVHVDATPSSASMNGHDGHPGRRTRSRVASCVTVPALAGTFTTFVSSNGSAPSS